MSQKVLNILSVVFSICAFVFFIVGCIGYASAERTMRNVAWITANDHTTHVKLWVDLTGSYSEATGYQALTKFADCSESTDDSRQDMCETCLRDGNATFALLIVATFFSAIVTVLSGMAITTPNASVQAVSAFSSFVSGCFSLIGFGLFMGSCYWQIDDITNLNLHYGPGAIIVLLGLLMMWVTVFFQIGAIAVGGKQ